MISSTTKHYSAYAKSSPAKRQTSNTALMCFIVCIAISFHLSAQANYQAFFNTQRRKNELYQSIEQLAIYPDSLQLTLWIRPFNKFREADLAEYRDEIAQRFNTARQQLNASQKIKWLYEIGMVETNLNNTPAAFDCFRKAAVLINKTQHPEAYIKIGTEIAFLYRQEKNCLLSNQVFNEMLQLARQTNNKSEQIHIKYWMAENFCNLGDYQNAMRLSNELYQYATEHNDFANASCILTLLGEISAQLESDTSYFSYFHAARNMADKSGLPYLMGEVLSKTSAAYQQAGLFNTALLYYKQAQKYERYFSVRRSLSYYNGVSAIYLALDSLNKANNYTKRALQIAQQIPGKLWQTEPISNRADYFAKTQQTDSAIFYHLEATRLISQQHMWFGLIKKYKTLSDLYLQNNDFTKAYSYLDSAYQAYIKHTTQNNAKALQKIRSETDYYIQQNQITELVSRNHLAIERSKRLKQVSVIFGLLLLSTIVFFFKHKMQFRALQDSHFNLLKKNIELDKAIRELHRPLSQTPKKNKPPLFNIKLLKKLEQLLIEEQAFCDPNLSLKSLAKNLNTNTSYLSSLVNTKYNCNFKTLVNRLRINKAKELLISPEFKEYCMEGIAEHAGFRSRSSFYNAFKAHTGLTPSQYTSNYHLLQQKSSKIKR